MAEHNDIGKYGEQKVCEYLAEHGYEILANNWHVGSYEVDIIAVKNGILCFVEVKTRTSAYFGAPEVFVTKTKQKNIIAAADKYVSIHHRSEEIRFDIASVLIQNKQTSIHYIPDAFRSSWKRK